MAWDSALLKQAQTALLVIDVQRDFCAGGQLPVPDADAIVPLVNKLVAQAATVVLTQDWQPADHSSFASAHAKAFSTIETPEGTQTLWPDHCVQQSDGAKFHKDLDTAAAQVIIRKGFEQAMDSYSAFFENDQKTPTGLQGWLATKCIKKVVLVGLATDCCVTYSALDAIKLGFEVHVLLPACRAIDQKSAAEHCQQMRDAGVTLWENL
jgi:nicotinamidase/pyrazinamidase